MGSFSSIGTSCCESPDSSQRPHSSLLLVRRSGAGLPLRKRACVHRLPIAQKRGDDKLVMNCSAGF